MTTKTNTVFKAYSNLSNAKRAAAKLAEGTYKLNKLDGGKVEIVEVKPEPVVVAKPAKAAKGQTLKFPEALDQHGCPHCGDIHNGCTIDSKDDNSPWRYCHICDTSFHGETGKVRKARKTPGTVDRSGRTSTKGLQVQKARETRNGVSRYSDGSVGARLWLVFDGLKGADRLSAKAAVAAAEAAGLNGTSAGIGYYRWKRFNGL